MKQIIATLSLLIFLAGSAIGQGIEFFHGTWTEALEKAKTENKLIFVDAYAVWCGPCKRMSANVFPQQKAGDFFNTAFVNMKIDMEKSENAEFARQFPVGSYPTLMFIDGTGKIVHKEVGARDVDALIELGKKALAKTDQSADLEKRYAAGERDPKFLLDYVTALNRSGKPSLKITNDYLKTQTDFTTPLNLKFLLEGAVEADSRVFDLLLKHRAAVSKQEGQGNVDKRLESACRNTVKKAVSFQNEELLNEGKAKMNQALPARAAEFATESDMAYYAGVKDAKKYLKAVQSYQKSQIKNNAAQLHGLVVKLVQAFPSDEKVLDQAASWGESAAENGGLPDYYLTLADVYRRHGKIDKARRAAEKAREVAPAEQKAGIGAKVDYFLQGLN